MVKATGDLITADDWNNLAVVPVGAILGWSADTAPAGWLLCTGQAVSRTEYPALFAVIDTTYGAGDGGSTFNLPDLRGRFPLGKDNMGGTGANRVTATQADQLGGAAGAETHALTASELPVHAHRELAGSTSPASPVELWNYGNGSSVTLTKPTLVYQNQTAAYLSELYTGDVGNGSAHNNIPPYLTLNYIIKA